MALTVKIHTRVEVVDGNGVLRAADGLTPYDPPLIISAASGVVHDQSHSILTTAIAKIFDVSEDISDFDFLLVVADQDDCLLEVVIDDGAEVGESYQVEKLKKNLPRMFGTDDGLASDGAVALFTGTADLIETLRVKNGSANTAIVRVLAVT